MNRSTVIVLGLIAVCLGVASGILARHRRPGVPQTQTQEGQGLAQLSEPLDAQAALTSTRQESGPAAVSSEPPRLASEMRRVLERERELAGTPEENERFWAQFGRQLANLPAPPPEFIRKSEAQWVGTGNPEDTFQSVLWSLHHRRLDAFLRLLAPDTAERLRKQIGDSPERFFDAAAAISAMRLSDQKFFGAATIKAQLDLGPDDPDPKTIFFFLLDGQWKMVLDADARFTP
jgi:hypothetical protein